MTTPANANTADHDNKHICRHYLSLALPMAIGMLFNGLYNLVDAFFIAKYLGTHAFGAVSSVFPWQMLLIALATMIGNGVSILVSQYRARKQQLKVAQVIATALILVVMLALIFALLAIGFAEPVLNVIGIPTSLFADAKAYFVPLTGGAVLLLLSALIADILRAQNKMPLLLLLIVMAAASNILLDALFIVVFDFGITGAAMATLFSQLLTILLAIIGLFRSEELLALRRINYSFNLSIAKQICAIGLPVFSNYFGAVAVMFIINNTLLTFALAHREVMLAAYGIVSRLNIFIILPLIAISQAGQTVIAHNVGAQNFARVKQGVFWGLIIATSYLSIMAGLLTHFPQQIITLFSQQTALVSSALSISHIMFLALPIIGVSAITVAFFQASHGAKLAMVQSSLPVYLFLLPLLVLIPQYYSWQQLWYAFPIAQGLSMLLAVTLLIWNRHHLSVQTNNDIFKQEKLA